MERQGRSSNSRDDPPQSPTGNEHFFRNYSAHTVYDHSPALDSGFRQNDVSYYAVFKLVMPAKAGAFRYPVLM
jgi:hypothetical protein